ncbi:MAG TPA: bifunctional DNA primase/polymerase, partial [Coleofasciculaceae cyanobacterium]
MTANATVIDRTRTPSSPLQVLSKERFSRNPEVNETILWLREQGYPALPIAPLVPVPKGKKLRFSGKNPSWLSRWGQPCLLDHKLYQERLPTDDELKQWFSHVDTGIATMGGWNSTLWIDIDAKRFNSVEECQRVFQDYLRDTRLNTFTETTQSGGWRLGVKLKEMPEFSKFSFRPQGKLVGELIGSGMIAVLAPTIGTVGTYRSISRIPPVEIESLEQIGLYPYRKVSQSNVAPQPLFTRS